MTLLAGYWGFDIIIILLSVVAITAYFYMTRNFNYWRKRGVPEIPPTPFVGNFGKCFLMKSASNLLKEFHNQAKGQPYIGFYIFDKPALLICDRKLLQKILIKDFNYFCNRYGIADKKDRMGYANLFSIENPAWKTVRMKLSSFFTSAKLKNTLNLILQNAKNLEDYLDTLELKGDGKIIDVKSLSNQFTANVTGSVAFGLDVNSFKNPDDDFYIYGKGIFYSSIRRGCETFAIFFLPKVVSMIGIKLFGKESTAFIRNIFWQIVNARMLSKQKRYDFIDTLIELKETYGDQDMDGFKFDGDDLVAQTASFFSAGSDTSALPMMYSLYELARHPEIQNKLRNEILKKLNESDGNVTYQMLISEMPYLDMVLSEVLRLYPSLAFLDRQTIEDYKISDTNMVIEKGTPIFVSMLGFHYDPKYFPEPDRFNPERFSEENKRNIPLYAYFPFGDGPHMCIGIRLALLIVKMMIITVLKKHEVLVCEKTPNALIFEPKALMTVPLNDILHLNMRRIENINVK